LVLAARPAVAAWWASDLAALEPFIGLVRYPKIPTIDAIMADMDRLNLY
jgi:hypothetical protein